MKVLKLKEAESTNLDCFKLLKNNEQALVISEIQTKGRGRNTNTWESPKGNIYLSVGKKIEICNLPNLSQSVAIEILKYLKTIVNEKTDLRLKWPNDIFINGKKLCGILVESKISGNVAVTVAGIGLNYKVAPIEESIALNEFTKETKENVEMGIAESCLNAFTNKDLNEIYNYFNQYNLLSENDLIEFKINEQFQKGKFIEISKNMELKVEIEGKTIYLNSAEVRKITKNEF